MSTTKFYYVWSNMLNRTTNIKHPQYVYYGNKGIFACDEWAIFENFMNDMFLTYEPGLFLSRKDTSKGYYKDNCIWLPQKEQLANRNMPRGKLYEHKGEKKILKEWADKTGIKYTTLRDRLKRGWSFEKTITTKTGSYQQKSKHSE